MTLARNLYRYRWLIAAAIFVIGVALKLNGSSVGMWDTVLGRDSTKGLLLFQPQSIRTDEWLVWTPAALAQARHVPPFPAENPNLGLGRAPLLLNLPIAYYTTWFRPQLWGFFLFDFEHAYAFCWWVKVFALVLAPAWLLRQLGVRSRSLAMFGGVAVFFSMQWWFTSPAMVPELVASWAICTGCAVNLFRLTNRWHIGAALAGFVYCGVNFLLCSYPPAEISLVYGMVAIVIGFIWERRLKDPTFSARPGIRYLGAAILLLLIVLTPCLIDLKPTLEAVSRTMYPGGRRSSGGALSIFHLFSGLSIFFQTRESLARAFTNPTQPCQWFPAWPVVIAMMAVAHLRKREKMSPLLLTIAAVIFCLTIYCVVKLPAWLGRTTLLTFSTEFSTQQFAIGPLNIILICLFLDRYRHGTLPRSEAMIGGAICVLVMALVFWTASLGKPVFFPSRLQILLSFLLSALLFGLLFSEKRTRWFPITLSVLLALSVGGVNPVMRGLAPLLESQAFAAVDRIRSNDPNAKWVVFNSLALPELVRATGASVVNGFRIVPDLAIPRRFDPWQRADFAYNRYGHFVCHLPERIGQMEFRFVAADYYTLFVSPGDSDFRLMGCRYLVMPILWPEAEQHSFKLIEQLPGAEVYIYRTTLGD